MEHVVFYTGADGAAQYRRLPNLDEAVRVVERLRNADGVEDSTVFSLTEVPLTVKAVYVVEVPGAQDSAVAAPSEPAPVEAPAEAPAEVLAAPEPVVEVVADPLAELTVPAMPGAEPVAEPAAVAEPIVEPAPQPVVEETAEPIKVEAAANGSSRGLGFFSR